VGLVNRPIAKRAPFQGPRLYYHSSLALAQNRMEKMAELLKAQLPVLRARATASCLSLEYVLDERYLVRADFVSHPSYGIFTPFVQVFGCNTSPPRLLSFGEARAVLCSSTSSSSSHPSQADFVEELHPELLSPSLTLHVCGVPTTAPSLPACLCLYFPKLRLPPIPATLYRMMIDSS
jgi:hypothetical protein